MSLFPHRVKRDSENGGTYDKRQKAALLWREAMDNGVVVDRVLGSRYIQDFMSIADAPTVGTLTGEIAVRDLEANATSEACIKAVPSSTAQGGLHGWVRASATTGADDRGIQVSFPNIGDVKFTAGKRSIFEASVNLRKGSDWFIGFGESGAAIMTDSDSFADKDYFGFLRQGGALTFITHKTGVTAQSVTVLTEAQLDALAAGGSSTSTGSNAEVDLPINLGAAYNGNGKIDIVVNGEVYATAAATIEAANASTACFPTLSMTRVLCVGRDDTDDEATVAVEIDWLESFQGA